MIQKKNLVALSVVGVVCVAWATFLFMQNTKGPQTPEFIQKLPQFQNLDKSKTVCMQVAGDQSGGLSVDCFVPNDFDNKLNANLDPEAYKKTITEGKIINAEIVEENKKGTFNEFFDKIHGALSAEEYEQIRNQLKIAFDNKKASLAEWERYAYLLSLEGKYDQIPTVRSFLCTTHKAQCETDKITYQISGKISDTAGAPIVGARVQVFGQDTSVLSDANGKYAITTTTYEKQRIRMSAFKEGYLKMYDGAFVLTKNPKQSKIQNFILAQSSQNWKIEKNKATNGNVEIKNLKNTFTLDLQGLRKKNGTIFAGNATAYFFDENTLARNIKIDKFTWPSQYASSDFSSPIFFPLQIVSDQWEELEIDEAHPIVWQSTLSENMTQFLEDKTAFLKDIFAASQNTNTTSASKNTEIDILKYWIPNTKIGAFYNQKLQFIDEKGTFSAPFFTLSKK